MRKIATSALALSLLLGANNGIVNASESTTSTTNTVQEHTEIPQEDIIQLKSFLNSYDVSQETQNALIEKLNTGNLWDSIKEGEKPTHSYEVQTNDIIEKVEVYKDGSIVVTSIDYEDVEEVTENELITPFGVSPGTITSGTGYKNFKKAKVYYSNGLGNAYFYADFTIVQGGNDYISQVYDYSLKTLGGTASEVSLKINRAKETLDYRAEAKLSFIYTAFNNAGSTTCWLKLNVGRDSYSETHSF